MKRNVDLREISDGRLYTAEDMVRADCHDCQGCSACCSGMGDSVILDPMDIWRLYRGTGMEFTELVKKGYVELGICRLFPLGRYYEDDGGFRYFLQIYECRKKNRSKIKVKKWLGIPDIKKYERYIIDWHDFLIRCEEGLKELDEQNARILRIYVLRIFFQNPFEGEEEEFYKEFWKRMDETKEKLQLGR